MASIVAVVAIHGVEAPDCSAAELYMCGADARVDDIVVHVRACGVVVLIVTCRAGLGGNAA
jgi:hypothetical protein